MSDYTKSTNFATKDGLSTGDPAKIVKGTEIDTEFNAIASAISSKADSSDLTDLSGLVVQVVQSVSTSTASTSAGSSYVTTGHSASITPTSASSKILVTVTFSMKNSAGYDSGFTIYRNSTNLAGTSTNFAHAGTYAGGETEFACSMQYLDSPASTSSTTYTVYMLNPGSPSTLTYNIGQGNGSQTGAAVITLLEITQ